MHPGYVGLRSLHFSLSHDIDNKDQILVSAEVLLFFPGWTFRTNYSHQAIFVAMFPCSLFRPEVREIIMSCRISQYNIMFVFLTTRIQIRRLRSAVMCTRGGGGGAIGPIVEKHMLKCLLGSQKSVPNCPLGWLKRDKLPSWEPKDVLKCPLGSQKMC